VYDYPIVDGKSKATLNRDETTLAQKKQELIKERFKDWIWEDAERRNELIRIYNDKFNSTRPREYDNN
jgi:N12 class adenine-specific DNA methylase